MLLDIKTLANTLTEKLRDRLLGEVLRPHLAIVQVGDVPASTVYVRNKMTACEKIGIRGTLLNLPDTITADELRYQLYQLNRDPDIHGILLQSPLPSHIDEQSMYNSIVPEKDVDGFSADSIARIYRGDEGGLVPGTPMGVMKICEAYFQKQKAESRKQKNEEYGETSDSNTDLLAGKTAVVIGKSTIVGKPLAMLLLNAGVTVTVCHSRTHDLGYFTRQADIVISAVGKKHLITSDMIRPGSLVIDVGINVADNTDPLSGKRKIHGDCDPAIAEIADLTPVPGGVGPMTIVMLLTNVVKAWERQTITR